MPAPLLDPAPDLVEHLREVPVSVAHTLLESKEDGEIVEALGQLDAASAVPILRCFKLERRNTLLETAAESLRNRWELNLQYPDESIGSLMEPPVGLFAASMTVAEAVKELREMVKRALITYGYVVDASGRLEGVLVMRDLLLADGEELLGTLMIANPNVLKPEMSLADAMRAVLNLHYPVYPVCAADGRLVGVIRGQRLFERRAVELSLQAGSMVGVEKEERVATPWKTSLIYRHPWLQLNLFTAFLAAAVVGVFESTLEQIVLLAVFLPVLAGQSGNTGCQALAVALRGLTLGEFKTLRPSHAVIKEALLGALNGGLVGLTAGLGMFAYASWQQNPDALMLGLVVFLAMVASCVVSGVSGAVIPLVLKRLGADPATASSIFLTTATDVVSMGVFLLLATVLLL